MITRADFGGDEVVPLSEAAHRLGLSWPAAWRLVLIGRLSGGKANGRWFVRVASIEEARDREKPPPFIEPGVPSR